jgi:2'-5' RNA ligase
MPPFLVAFDRAMSFDSGEKNALVLRGDEGLSGLMMLQHDLVTALQEAGVVRRKGLQFTPHITLLYDKCRVREQAVEEIRWTVREIVLVQSLYGQSRHIPLARWPLGGE